ncbi:general transcription factor IIF subunit 1 [Latimeria chalumnae]|uniref:general transcription factor IIF subunit 1 n=1 Tax=Latimeria chalumnae TaxID=7897 RepID=UPI0006D90206|nr:PREDICTED: general transcription factor IIF subunit 1 [Latimeria chalumnae]|eukprot:XP_014342919.1 PREDICTED: general transcription factor IIF subunit 1 [Latimeria chalumnae]
MAALGTSGQSVTEYVVRVPKNTTKKYNIMAFNAGDKVNFSTWTQAKMERDISNKKIYQEEEMPDRGAGSEYGKKFREEARKKKFGIITKEFKLEDQPWLLKVNGKAGRKFKGVKKGGVTENASYYIFTQCPDGAFEAFPVNAWYNFTPVAKHRTLTMEEAEEEWGRRNKVVNHFSIMLQRRLRDQDRDDGEEEEKEKKGKKKRKKSSELKIHDLEDDLELSSDESEESEEEEEEGEKKPKTKKKPTDKKKKKKKGGSDNEALEDSDDGDFEGQEVDYMSDESSSEEEEPEKVKPNNKEENNVPKGIDEGSESSEESEEEKPNEEKEEEEEEKKPPAQQEKKKKKDSSDESETSEDSDIDNETTSALLMLKKKTPPKKEKKGSACSSAGHSRPGTPSVDTANTSSTLRAAANKLEQGKRQGGSGETPAAKRLKMDSRPQSPSGKSTPQPQSGKSTPNNGDVQLTEEAVRRYLTRKPMTTKDLLKKFQTKKTGLSSEQTVNVLAQILKRLNPERKKINEKMHFFLKE